jgi:hypothetical protein
MTKTRTFRLALLAAAGAVFFIYAWENLQATRLGYGIEGLRKEIKDSENANKYLKKEIRLSLSPEKLQAEALKLGLVYPEPDALVMLDDAGNKPEKGWFAQLFRFTPNFRADTPATQS